jgi:hypothetical protein
MCYDVRLLREGLKSIANQVDYLIFDLQGNVGGNENSAFLKSLSPNSFTHSRVLYKKTQLIEVDSLRRSLNYGNPNAESWFQYIKRKGIYDKTKYGDFLPERGDFCQGSKKCEIKPIKTLGGYLKKIKKILILTDDLTTSSSDDFVFRMKASNSNVYIAGQNQAADLTYALITAYYYLEESNKVQRVFIGNHNGYVPNGTPLFQFDIPYSRTVDKNGSMLQGAPPKLDLEVPITMDNFKYRQKFVLDEAVRVLIKESK